MGVFQNVESWLEGTRVEPGPIRPVRPAEFYLNPGQPAPEQEAEYIRDAEADGSWSYPSVFVGKERVVIAYSYSTFEDDPAEARLIQSSRTAKGYNQKQIVLPLKWFYGGKMPADNPFLQEAYQSAKNPVESAKPSTAGVLRSLFMDSGLCWGAFGRGVVNPESKGTPADKRE